MKGKDPKTGRFQRGNPGGPGRPRNEKIDEWKAIVEKRMPELLDKAIETALDGDTAALRLLLARLWPEQQQAMADLQERMEELQSRLDDLSKPMAA